MRSTLLLSVLGAVLAAGSFVGILIPLRSVWQMPALTLPVPQAAPSTPVPTATVARLETPTPHVIVVEVPVEKPVIVEVPVTVIVPVQVPVTVTPAPAAVVPVVRSGGVTPPAAAPAAASGSSLRAAQPTAVRASQPSEQITAVNAASARSPVKPAPRTSLTVRRIASQQAATVAGGSEQTEAPAAAPTAIVAKPGLTSGR